MLLVRVLLVGVLLVGRPGRPAGAVRLLARAAVLILAVLLRPVLTPLVVLGGLLVIRRLLAGVAGLVGPRRGALASGTVPAGAVPAPSTGRADVTRQSAVVGLAQPRSSDRLQVGKLALVVGDGAPALPVWRVIAVPRSAASRPVRK
jgi:hypothetical protein